MSGRGALALSFAASVSRGRPLRDRRAQMLRTRPAARTACPPGSPPRAASCTPSCCPCCGCPGRTSPARSSARRTALGPVPTPARSTPPSSRTCTSTTWSGARLSRWAPSASSGASSRLQTTCRWRPTCSPPVRASGGRKGYLSARAGTCARVGGALHSSRRPRADWLWEAGRRQLGTAQRIRLVSQAVAPADDQVASMLQESEHLLGRGVATYEAAMARADDPRALAHFPPEARRLLEVGLRTCLGYALRHECARVRVGARAQLPAGRSDLLPVQPWQRGPERGVVAARGGGAVCGRAAWSRVLRGPGQPGALPVRCPQRRHRQMEGAAGHCSESVFVLQ